MKSRYIVHADMDAFFASVEQRDNPAYRGKPIVVGADPKKGKGRGVVSTCSYEARAFGICSAMPISQAYDRCPHAVFLPVDIGRYLRVSEEIYAIFDSFTPDVEPVGIDEAFLDITGSYHLFGTPLQTCLQLKSRVRLETGLTISVGLAPIKMAAKIASDLKKPDGMVEVTREHLLDFLRPLEVRKIWGLGPKSEEVLLRTGIKTIGDLANRSARELKNVLGRSGLEYWRLANGIDDRTVEVRRDTRSISNELTFEEDIADRQLIKRALVYLTEKVSDRLRQSGFKCRTVTIKIRLSGFETFTRSNTMVQSSGLFGTLDKEVKRLYNSFDHRNRKVRLVGVKTSGLVPAGIPDDLFFYEEEMKAEETAKAVDKIKCKFGRHAIYHAGGMKWTLP